jgi:hypothetical protein
MPFGVEVPPEELVEPPEEVVEPPDDDVEPPDDDVDEVDPPEDDVELVLLVELPPELVDDGSVPFCPVSVLGSVGLVVDAMSDDGFAKRSLSVAPPHAARTAIDEATAALKRRRGFMRVAKH